MKELFNRSKKKPYIFGDIFNHENGAEIIIVNPVLGTAFYKAPNDNNVSLILGFSIERMKDQGFKPNEEHIQESIKIKDYGLFAPRKLEDDTWSALTPLLFTTAICVDYDYVNLYSSRYCFEESELLNRHENALLWLSRFKNSLSLPVGNVAFRGYLGKDPIIDPKTTFDYYDTLEQLRYPSVEIDKSMSIKEYARSFLHNTAVVSINNGIELIHDYESEYSPYSPNYK